MRLIACVLALCAPIAAAGQDQALFDAGLGECVRYITAKPEGAWDFQTPPVTLDEDEGGTEATVVYPQGSAGNYAFAVGFSHEKGTSTRAGAWTCSGNGPQAPLWPQFDITGWIGADARLRANGLVELNFPGPQRAYADCLAQTPDIYVLFTAGDGDRAVFAALTGPSAAGFCTSMGWKG